MSKETKKKLVKASNALHAFLVFDLREYRKSGYVQKVKKAKKDFQLPHLANRKPTKNFFTYKYSKGDYTTMSNNSIKIIDGLFENYPYKDVLKLLGFDSISDLSEYLTGGNYDEGQARELCKDVLDGSDLDDIDPETEHGDEMCDRLAGK